MYLESFDISRRTLLLELVWWQAFIARRQNVQNFHNFDAVNMFKTLGIMGAYAP